MPDVGIVAGMIRNEKAPAYQPLSGGGAPRANPLILNKTLFLSRARESRITYLLKKPRCKGESNGRRENLESELHRSNG